MAKRVAELPALDWRRLLIRNNDPLMVFPVLACVADAAIAEAAAADVQAEMCTLLEAQLPVG